MSYFRRFRNKTILTRPNSQVQKVKSPISMKEKCISRVVRSGSIIIFHLSKLWKAKFFILCNVIFLARLQEKVDIDHSWEWKGDDASCERLAAEHPQGKTFPVKCFRVYAPHSMTAKILRCPRSLQYYPLPILGIRRGNNSDTAFLRSLYPRIMLVAS